MATTTAYSKRSTFLPFSKPSLGDEEIQEVVETLKSGWITTGPRSAAFEEMLKKYIGARDVIAFSSATAGMHCALSALGIGPGDEVITPSLTWVSTPNMIELLGARPVFVDIDKDTMQTDHSLIEKKITPKTKAIIPVHFAGQTCDLDEIKKIALRHNIPVIEDAAHALGAEYKKEKIGRDSFCAIFSTHVIKNITTSEGGIIATNNASLAEKLGLLKFHGIQKDAWSRYSQKGEFEYGVVFPGYKYNFTDLQAAIGIHQLKKLDAFNDRRRELAERYTKAFSNLAGIELNKSVSHEQKNIWHLYVIKLAIETLNISRNTFMRQLRDSNIGTGIHFLAVHLQPYYREKYGYKKGDLPVTEYVSERIVSLPLYPGMTNNDQDDVIRAVSRVVGGVAVS